MKFQDSYPLDKRLEETNKIKVLYPDRIPIICERNNRSTSAIPEIDKVKYLVPLDLTVGQFLYVIRKRIRLSSSHSIFLLSNRTVLQNAMPLFHIYEEHRDKDGFLYVEYVGENVFGTF